MIDDAPRLRLPGLRKASRRRDGVTFNAVDDLNIETAAEESRGLLGANGCGKTTLRRCVAGLERPDAGQIEINGNAVFDYVAGLNVSPEP